MKFQEIITEINNAFFRLESFMNGSISNYQYFGFNEAFTSLFSEAKKPENFTYNNCKLIGKYWDLIEQIRVDYDRSDFKYTEAYENENFCKDCDEIMYVNWDRIGEFMVFSTPDEIAEAERKFSITDILKAPTLPPQPIVKQKPELTINQIALKYVYELLQITRENGKEIARKYGHNSGEKLFQRFTYYSSTANRKGKPIPCTPKKLDNKIKLIESVIELLPTDKQERAKDEVSILKEIYEAEYQ
jgi:hypothetical protein